jgi:hypothetical protein
MEGNLTREYRWEGILIGKDVGIDRFGLFQNFAIDCSGSITSLQRTQCLIVSPLA